MSYRVSIIIDNDKKQIDLDSFGKDVISFGRSDECDIGMNKGFVSRLHGCFYHEDGEWRIKDLESTNGIYCNGKKIEESPLKPGDTYELLDKKGGGDSIRIVSEENGGMKKNTAASSPAVREDKRDLSGRSGGSSSGESSGAIGIVIALIVLLLLGGGVFFIINSMNKNKAKEQELTTETVQPIEKPTVEEATLADASEGDASENDAEPEPTPTPAKPLTKEEKITEAVKTYCYKQITGLDKNEEVKWLSYKEGEDKFVVQLNISDDSVIFYTVCMGDNCKDEDGNPLEDGSVIVEELISGKKIKKKETFNIHDYGYEDEEPATDQSTEESI